MAGEKSKSMVWTETHKVLLCRVVLLMDPYQFKPSTRERGNVWEANANGLNSVNGLNVKFNVSKRKVRDKLNTMLSQYNLFRELMI